MIYLISFNDEWLEAARDLFKEIPGFVIEHKDIRSIDRKDTCFVSPANSLGFMDGGIDFPLSRHVLPGIERKVKQRIKDLGLETRLGRPYLPIGSVIIVPHDTDDASLIVTPTMFLPHNVQGTKNPYWSYYAALTMWEKWCKQNKKQYNLVLTSHCCGCGQVPGQEAATQLKQAYDDCMKKSGEKPVQEFQDGLLYSNHNEEQPRNYDNREIQEGR